MKILALHLIITLMMSGFVYSNDIQCIFNELSDRKDRVNVDEIIIIDSRLEEKTSYNTFNIQVEAISPTSKIVHSNQS